MENDYKYENEMRLRRAVEDLEYNIGNIWKGRPDNCRTIEIKIKLEPDSLPITTVSYEKLTK